MNTQRLKEQQATVDKLYLLEEPLNLFNYQEREALAPLSEAKPTNQPIKIYSKVSHATYDRLKKACDRRGYKSIYQLMQHLAYLFLRVADSGNDPIDLPVPSEIEEMFAEYEGCDQYTDASCFTEKLGISTRPRKRIEPNIEDF